ncbi:hypothetical protein [Vibrio owensii]|uniref:hypothetical protein n=1 Tax=Vibrio harveyi group TaxID=717610 RepID=UPI003CC5DF73
MNNQDVVLQFIQQNKRGICFLMGVSEKGLKDQDVKILMSYLTYKAGKSTQNGEFDLSIILDLEKLPPEKKCEAVLLKACEWFEKGQLFSRSVPELSNDSLKFSPRVEQALSIRYEAKLKREFTDLSTSVIRMKKGTANLIRILKQNSDLKDPVVVNQIKGEFRHIRSAIQSANYRAKAGMLWAHRHGLPIETAIKSVSIVYLRHLRDLSHTMRAIDNHLRINKIRTNGEEMIMKHYQRWYNELGEALEQNHEKNLRKTGEIGQLACG